MTTQLTYIQSVKTGRIYAVLPEAAKAQLKGNEYRKVDDDRVQRITNARVAYSE